MRTVSRISGLKLTSSRLKTLPLPAADSSSTPDTHHRNAHPYLQYFASIFEHTLIDIVSGDERSGRCWYADGGLRHLLSYCGKLLCVHIFSPQYFAGKILVHISVFYVELRLTRWLIYYPAIDETGSNKPEMGTFAPRYCGWLLRVHIIFSQKVFATSTLLHISTFRLEFCSTRTSI